MKMILTFLLPLLAAGIANNSVPPSLAATGQQAQEVNSSGGDLFMEEVTPATAPKVRPPTARARILDSNGNVVNPAAGKSMQSVQDKGGIFMQEVDTPPQGEKRRAYVDLSNVGVQVDPSGNAVPLINHSGLTWTPPGRAAPVSLEVRLWGDAWLLCGTALALTLVAVLSAWWPARRAARLQVVEALRHA